MYKTVFYIFSIVFLTFYSCKDDETCIDQNNNDLTKSIQIVRDRNTKDATFSIVDIGQNWKLYAGNSLSTINMTQPILDGNTSGNYKLAVSNDIRSYFQLVTSSGNIYFSEKHLPMTGGFNFRDLGGIKTMDGKTLQWGKLFRADEFKNLTDNDLNYLSSIPLTTNVDFRSSEEIDLSPHKLPNSLKNYINLSISPGSLTLNLSKITVDEADSFMVNLNLKLVTDSLSINQYKKFFALLQNESYLPLIYNCSAGKDRTGLATALILYSLNVDEEIIFNDYLASNIYLADKYASNIETYPHLKPLFEVRREFLKAGIDKIKENYGTIDNYLVTVLNVDLAKMKQLYLY